MAKRADLVIRINGSKLKDPQLCAIRGEPSSLQKIGPGCVSLTTAAIRTNGIASMINADTESKISIKRLIRYPFPGSDRCLPLQYNKFPDLGCAIGTAGE